MLGKKINYLNYSLMDNCRALSIKFKFFLQSCMLQVNLKTKKTIFHVNLRLTC